MKLLRFAVALYDDEKRVEIAPGTKFDIDAKQGERMLKMEERRRAALKTLGKEHCLYNEKPPRTPEQIADDERRAREQTAETTRSIFARRKP